MKIVYQLNYLPPILKCYIKCYLEKIGILSQDNKIYKQRAVEMLWTQAGEAIDGCLSEMSWV